MVGATGFVLLRYAFVARHNITRFIFAGRDFVNPAEAPKGLFVFPGTGYDGQFYYRIALNPANLDRTAYGITLDNIWRVQRIGYPVLAWLAAAGQHDLVPYSEVAVNIAALGVMAWFGAVIARDSGRHAVWGLLPAAFFGFVFSLGRDLPEIVASTFVLGGLVALRRDQTVSAGLLFAGAVLSVETTLDVVIAIALAFLGEIVLGRRRLCQRDAAWLVPCVAFAAWQIVGWAATGRLPLRADSQANIGLPFVNMVGAVRHYLLLLPSEHAALWLGQLVVLAVVVGTAGWSLFHPGVRTWERTAWFIALIVVLCLARGIWYGKADFRGYEDLYLLSTVALLASRRRLWLVGAMVALAFGVTFAHRVVLL